MSKVNVAVVVGSNRRDSINRKFAQALIKLGRDNFNATMLQIDDLPLFNQDMEKEPTPSVVRFKSELEKADGLLVVTPEHNRSVPAVLKNAIDWGSRPPGKNSWAGKPVAIAGTSGGAISTALAQAHLRLMLGILRTQVMGGEVYLNFKPDLIDDNGDITDEKTRKFLQDFVDQFAVHVARYVS